MANVKIFVDTSADMPEELQKQYDIGMINFLSVFGETTYVAGEALSNAEFYKKLSEAPELPKTAQTPYLDMYDILNAAAQEYDTVVYFTISSKGSGQYHTATRVAEEIMEQNPDADVRIFDTMKYSLYIAAAAVYARKLLDEGMDIDAVLERCRAYLESWEVYILVDSLEFLQKGGRIKKSTAVIGTLLDIRPVLTIRDGLIDSIEKIRGKKKIFEKLIALIKENPEFDAEKKEFMVIHSDLENGLKLKEAVQQEFGISDIYMFSEFGPIVGTHIGPGALAVLFRKK